MKANSMPTPKKIKLNKQTESLSVEWDNGKIHEFPLKFLRDESPDASNKGETILWRHIPPPPKEPDRPGKYEIENIEPVGSYAITIKWKDGYDYGIYSWDLLLKMGDYLEVVNNLPPETGHKH
jgi:DUF971 family protein